MHIEPNDHILDLGAGTGKNDLLMLEYLSGGSITALEIGTEMRKQFQKKCGRFKNIKLENKRIENTLPYNEEFDKVVIYYVIHGFEQKNRERIVDNAYKTLKKGGRIFILDWNAFKLDDYGLIMRAFMKHIECEPALDFIQRDFKEVLILHGFTDIQQILYVNEKIRLLSGTKI